MKYICIALIFMLMSTSKGFADTTFVNGFLDDLRWEVEGSPYVIVNMRDTNYVAIGSNMQLSIEPGVSVLFQPYTGMWILGNGIVNAEGTIEDSIVFRSLIENEPDVWGISLIGIGSVNFDYCSILDNISDEYGAISVQTGTLNVSHSSFRRISDKFIWSREAASIAINHCCFDSDDSWTGVLISVRDGGFIRNSYFRQYNDDDRNRYPFVYIGSQNDSPFIIENCYFSEVQITGGGQGLRLRNSIMTGYEHGCRLLGPWWGDFPSVSNNCFLRVWEGDIFRGNWVEDLGVKDRVNANGDSTDHYSNLFQNPELNEEWAWGDVDFLSEDSPCIDAGDPDSPLDPDSTIADIGPFFFSQPNIGVSADSFAFPETFVEDADTLFFTIRNRGDQKDLRYFIDEEVLGRSFFVLGWLGEMAQLEPQESAEFALVFRPEAPNEYLDTLIIASNDRDEGVRAIPVRAFGANGVGDDKRDAYPTRFGLSAYPNPFNSTTRLEYSLPSASQVELAIYNLAGQRVALLVDNEGKAGRHRVRFHAGELPAGVYTARMQSAGFTTSLKLVVLK